MSAIDGSVVEAFHRTAGLRRHDIFADNRLEPVSSPQDAVTAAPGWVGPNWQAGGTLLVGINPGGGGDTYKGNATDAELYALIRAFRDAPTGGRAAALGALTAAWVRIQASHNIRLVVDAVFDATGSDARNAAFINVVPFRTRNDATPRRADLVRAWEIGSGPQVAALAPARIVALGCKAYDCLRAVDGGALAELVLIKRSIGDSRITAEAQRVLADLRQDQKPQLDRADPPSPRKAAGRSTGRQPPATQATRYEAVSRPSERDGYPQRIPMWEAVKRLGTANRSELLAELRKHGYARPNGASLDEAYCRIELTDMTKRGYLRRVSG